MPRTPGFNPFSRFPHPERVQGLIPKDISRHTQSLLSTKAHGIRPELLQK
jgi:hypothetical protein